MATSRPDPIIQFVYLMGALFALWVLLLLALYVVGWI